MLRLATKKVVRLPGGNYVTRKLMESDPETLARAKKPHRESSPSD